MSEKTRIAWTDHTWNLAWGCWKISPGCANCYADALSSRFGFKVWGEQAPRRTFGAKHWEEPLRWNEAARLEGRRHRVFCSSMTDWALDDPIIDEERKKLWGLIEDTPWLDWQLLTKRSDRMASCLPENWGAGYPNVWLGVSIENNDYVFRANHLRVIPAVVRFISYEPALGPLDDIDLTCIDWLIYGGESGPRFRKEDKQWARDIRARCRRAGTAFFHKQSAAIRTEMGIELDGEIVREYPRAGQATGRISSAAAD